MWKVQSILCPMDFSPPARAALDHALELAKVFEAKIHLVHAIEPPRYLAEGHLVELASGGVSLQDYMKERAENTLDDLVKTLDPPASVPVTREIIEGDPRRVIVKAAADADLVVMGTHGRTGLAHLFLGSVAEYVVRLSAPPVLTVRPEPTDD